MSEEREREREKGRGKEKAQGQLKNSGVTCRSEQCETEIMVNTPKNSKQQTALWAQQGLNLAFTNTQSLNSQEEEKGVECLGTEWELTQV